MTDTTTPVICCVRCAREFEGFTPTQAYDCACDVHGQYVVGAYGSTELDGESAIFATGEDHGLPHGQICDDCIRSLMTSGDLHHGFSHF